VSADAAPARASWRQRLEASWWRAPGLLSNLLWPLSALYGVLLAVRRAAYRRGWRRTVPVGVPVVVVGNLVAGGAGKTPTTLAVLRLLRERGFTPGVVSRGYGRDDEATVRLLARDSRAADVGDEPLLVHVRAAAPVCVGRDRVAACVALRAAHPEVDVIVSDDGLQHLRLHRDVQIVVLDGRGLGNRRLLPAGPLRQPAPPTPPADWLVVHNASAPGHDWPGTLARRALAGAVELADWWLGTPPSLPALYALRGRRVCAAAGIAQPQRFFAMLREQGLDIEALPLDDHARFDVLPWSAGTTDVLVTEKDAVKLDAARCAPTRVWVVALDFQLDAAFGDELAQRVAQARRT
jgi:tetraacyldisaccharide 4'-kinase